ncbi:MAG: DeoR/GlpR transcriptional regulator [Ruminococcaceae bacterium]|nr:DeoR/GlpR transcriptional regulator [Oscillospiraceae bacterium]
MYPKERRDAILEILKKQGYATVEDIISKLHYSSATINRDLNILQKQNLVKRSYGGVEPVKAHGIPLPYRYDKMKVEKRHIGREAAHLVEDGDTIFIDATTTTQSMAQYLTEKNNITVITNNMALAIYLSNYGIKVIVLGGEIIESPNFTGGFDAAEIAQKYHADKLFFSTGGITNDGRICSSYSDVLRVMLRNSDKAYCLVDHEKIGVDAKEYAFDFSKITGVISDADISHFKESYPDTGFIRARV